MNEQSPNNKSKFGMKLEKVVCDICKEEQRDPATKAWRWTDSFGENCELRLKSIAAVQTDVIWSHLCPACGRAILDAVTATVKERFKDL